MHYSPKSFLIHRRDRQEGLQRLRREKDLEVRLQLQFQR